MLIATILSACSKSLDKLTAVELLDLGEKYLRKMNYEVAILCFDRLIKVEPRNTYGYIGLVEAYTGLGDKHKAVEIL
jgi:tetratricopeptide (TPR) repeat protein